MLINLWVSSVDTSERVKPAIVLLQEGVTINIIQKATGLTVDQIQQLSDTLLQEKHQSQSFDGFLQDIMTEIRMSCKFKTNSKPPSVVS